MGCLACSRKSVCPRSVHVRWPEEPGPRLALSVMQVAGFFSLQLAC